MNIGIIGAGHIAGKMALTIQACTNANAYAIASRSYEKACEFAAEYGFVHAYGSYDELAGDPEVELVYVATPHSFHYEHIRMCLEHGKNVLCEKSFTLDASQASELISMAENRGLFLGEAIWTRYLPMRFTLDNLIKSKIIGEVMSVSASLSYPIAHKERIIRKDLGGGALLDIGVYCVNFASMVLGNDIRAITASAVLNANGMDMADGITMLYENGKMAVLHCDARTAGSRDGIVYGTDGYIVFHNINNCEGIDVYNMSHEIISHIDTPAQITGFEYELDAAIEAIQNGRTECTRMPHAEIIAVMEIMDRIREKTGVEY